MNSFFTILKLILMYYMIFGELPIGPVKFPVLVIVYCFVDVVIESLAKALNKPKQEPKVGTYFKEKGGE